jgi:hypothetical protein
MIVTEKVEIKLNNKTNNHYLSLGYKIDNGSFFVNVSDLPDSSRMEVECVCDYCLSLKKIKYYLYLKNISHNGKFSCGNKCGSIKKKEISLVKYGVDSPSKLEHIKEKNRNTCKDKYGVDSYMKTDEFKKKSKNKILEIWGVEHIMQSEEIKEKIKCTNLEKYGSENVFQSEEIKEKIKCTNLEKYGYYHFSKTKEYVDKFKNTCIERYGVDHSSKFEETKAKTKQTFINRFGGFPFQSNELLSKIKETNLEKYGSEIAIESEIIRKKNFTISNDKQYLKYLGNYISLFKCEECERDFEISSSTYHSRVSNNISICTLCNPVSESVSIKENELYLFICKNYGGETIQSYRDEMEIDIYLPEMKLGFEFNGLYYHSDRFKDKNYHLKKKKFFNDRGIELIHIWEDDWVFRNNIVKSIILNKINKTPKKIFARKCQVKEVEDTKLIRKFLDENHMQGFAPSSVKIGLFHNDEIVSVMLFDKNEGRKKMCDGRWNLSRFSNIINTNVVGGASKLLNFFISNYSPKSIISYADKDFSNGSLYRKLYFVEISNSGPDYKYVLNGKRIHKSNFQKKRMCGKFNINNKTESEIMNYLNIEKIYDCGKIKYEICF